MTEVICSVPTTGDSPGLDVYQLVGPASYAFPGSRAGDDPCRSYGSHPLPFRLRSARGVEVKCQPHWGHQGRINGARTRVLVVR
jgi:hypothetical protein